MTENLYIYILATCIVVLQGYDFYTTWTALKTNGVELNPVMNLLFDVFGTNLGLFLGKFGVGVLVICGAVLGVFKGTLGNSCLFIIFTTYVLVAIHNTIQLDKMRK